MHKKHYFLFVFAVFICFSALGQSKTTKPLSKVDSLKRAQRAAVRDSIPAKLKAVGEAEAARTSTKFNAERQSIKQERLIESLRKEILQSRVYIKAGIDTIGMNKELESVKYWIGIVGDGVLINKGSAQTYRNLTTTAKLLHELLKRTDARKEQIDKHERTLVDYRFRIDSLYANPVLYRFSADTTTAIEYAWKLINVGKEITPADDALKQAIASANKLQTKVNLVVNKITIDLDEIEEYQKILSAKTFDREFNNLDIDPINTRPFNQILHFSTLKAGLTLWFYAKNNFGEVILILLLIATSTLFLRSLRHIVSQQDNAIDNYTGQLVLRYPILSATIIILSLGQFIFPEPPFIFDSLFWVISVICLTIIFNNFISRYWMRVWLAYAFLFILSCIDNLILQASRVERWGMLALAIAGIMVGLHALIKGRKDELRQKFMLYFIALATLLNALSAVADIVGRYNLSKSLLISAYLNVIIGILFLWTIRLINEGLYLASKAYTKQDRRLFYINFNVVGERAPALFYIFLIIGWFILFGRNFYVYRHISDPLKLMFFEQRTIGDYSFSIDNLLVFFAIISVAIVSAKTASYFTSETDASHSVDKERKAGIGSWILLIRVGIIGTGTFLAFAAAGFPMDKIALVVGALGVGIGFGLQTLVQNLVSGVIIAFEKPVNVGDVVEIGGQGGTMKSIGFRSSILSKWDGPDMIIPNGDLLNSHLINWTLAGSKRQLELIVGVAYGTELQKTLQIITELLDKNERVNKMPKPIVVFQNFGDNSIDIRILFWSREFKESSTVKSEVIMDIDAAFKANGIVIPFPQQDVYFHNDKLLKPGTDNK